MAIRYKDFDLDNNLMDEKLFGDEKYDFIYNRTRHLAGVKKVLHMLFFIIMLKSDLIYTIHSL